MTNQNSNVFVSKETLTLGVQLCNAEKNVAKKRGNFIDHLWFNGFRAELLQAGSELYKQLLQCKIQSFTKKEQAVLECGSKKVAIAKFGEDAGFVFTSLNSQPASTVAGWRRALEAKALAVSGEGSGNSNRQNAVNDRIANHLDKAYKGLAAWIEAKTTTIPDSYGVDKAKRQLKLIKGYSDEIRKAKPQPSKSGGGIIS
jgi:hypothetical protein